MLVLTDPMKTTSHDGCYARDERDDVPVVSRRLRPDGDDRYSDIDHPRPRDRSAPIGVAVDLSVSGFFHALPDSAPSMSVDAVPASAVVAEFVVFVERYLQWLDRVDVAEAAVREAVRATGGQVYAGRSDGRRECVFYDIDSGEFLGQQICHQDGRTTSSAQLRSVDSPDDCLYADAPVYDVSDPRGFMRWIDSHLSAEIDAILTR